MKADESLGQLVDQGGKDVRRGMARYLSPGCSGDRTASPGHRASRTWHWRFHQLFHLKLSPYIKVVTVEIRA